MSDSPDTGDLPETVDLIERLRASRGTLTPKMGAICDLALGDTEGFIRSTSRAICERVPTSEPTLIRFCREMGHQGLSDFRIDLALSYARQPRPAGFVEPLAQDRRRARAAAKRLVAEAALPLLEGDRAILIDNGSTAEAFAAALGAAAPLTIMTTGLVVAQNALLHGRHEVMLTGGYIRAGDLRLSGGQVARALEGMRFDTFFMSADSVDPERGLSTYHEDEAQSTRAMVDAAGRVVVLADSSKVSGPSLHHICGFGRVDVLVTDLPETAHGLGAIRRSGTRIVFAAPPPGRAELRRSA